jgi:GNAT superfamily N-acetyltransferase
MEWTNGDYVMTDDPARLDLDEVCALLATSYWAKNRPREIIEAAVAASVCFSLFHHGRQVGFARAVTDHATFTWVCDVIIHPDHRGRGLGKWMMACFLDHPRLQTISQLLRTEDAHGLYERFGFKRVEAMRRSNQP